MPFLAGNAGGTFTSPKFLLDIIKKFLSNNGRVAILYVVLRYLAFVDFHLLCQEIGAEGLGVEAKRMKLSTVDHTHNFLDYPTNATKPINYTKTCSIKAGIPWKLEQSLRKSLHSG